MRLDQHLGSTRPELSRSTWEKHIKNGAVKVNGEVVRQTKFDVKETDSIDVDMPEMTDFSEQTLPILYEDDNVIVINKPIGVLTHSKGALNDEFTVADFFKTRTSYKAETNRPGIIHRLDRDTSGVLIGAKNDETASLLQRQFAQRKTKKTYIAVLDGVPKEHEAIIDLPIGRNPSAPSTFRVDASGKPAETYYEMLGQTDRRSMVKLQPRTGRTHQLRVHMAYLNTPIRGDRVYGTPASRLFLHAEKLELTLPGGTRTVFEAPVPPEFKMELAS